MLVSNLETPALLVDLVRLETNLNRMQARARDHGVTLRPHAKTHKCSAVAREQRERGVSGLTVATLGEAEAFAEAGFTDLFIAHSVVGEARLRRVQSLLDRGVRVAFGVDTKAGAYAASSFFATTHHTAPVRVEVDTGHGRCGVRADAAEAVAFIGEVAALPGLQLEGLFTHGGHAYAGPQNGETRHEALRRAMHSERDGLLDLAVRAHEAGHLAADAVLSVGSTPTASLFENRRQGPFRITEIRPGNYVFHDAQQVALGSALLTDCALTALATVVSVQPDEAGGSRVYLDAGKKVLTSDTGFGVDGFGALLYDPQRRTLLPHARLVGLSEEHGWVTVPGATTLAVGDRVQIVPNHACVAVSQAEALHVVRGEDVVASWPIDARRR